MLVVRKTRGGRRETMSLDRMTRHIRPQRCGRPSPFSPILRKCQCRWWKLVSGGGKLWMKMGGARIHHSSLLEQSLVRWQVDATSFAALTYPALHSGPRWVGIQTRIWDRTGYGCRFLWSPREIDETLDEPAGKKNKIHILIDTHNILADDRNPNYTLSPDLFVQGTGSCFPARRSTEKRPSWSSCVSIGDAKLNLGMKKMDTFGKFGTYAEQVFSAQENRRFVPSFHFDNSRLGWCTFDRGGAVQGDAVDYHRDPWKLWALVLHFLFHVKDRIIPASGIKMAQPSCAPDQQCYPWENLPTHP